MLATCLVLCALLVGVSNLTDAAESASLTRVHLEAVVVSDDDGGRACRVTPDEVRTWVAFADQVYRPAGFQLLFDPDRDLRYANSSLLNNMKGDGDLTPERVRLGNQIARQSPDKLVVLFRHGPGPEPTGQGFSWWDYDFVVMGGYRARIRCGHTDPAGLAHEIGHYLGLRHTFAHHPQFGTRDEAEAFLRAQAGQASCFDGDGFADTLPDPGIGPMACTRNAAVALAGIPFILPRRNIMSFYDKRDRLTPQQIRRVRFILGERLKRHLAAPPNDRR